MPSLTYPLYTLITASPINTDLLWGLSTFFVGLALLYLVSMFFFRNRISSKSLLTKQRKMELSPIISEFLFYEEEADKAEKSHYIGLKIEIRELLKDDFNRKMLAEILLDLRKDVSGDTQKRLFSLYQELGLEKDAFHKLKSWRWEIVSKGIFELTRMQVGDAYGFIVKFINDRRVTIRKQAEIATVTLKPGGINYFLDTTKYKISEWQQLKLLDVLRNKTDFEPPRFKAWLTSTNKDVVVFALRLIKYYNQNDANSSLIELTKHKDQHVRQQAIDCIKEFHVVPALPTLKGVFWKCSVDIKIAILGTIAELGNNLDVEFLQSVWQNEVNFSVKSKAVGAINTIAPESILPTEGIESVTDYQKSKEVLKFDSSLKEPAACPKNKDEIKSEPTDNEQTTDIAEIEMTSIESDAPDLAQARGPAAPLDVQPALADAQPETIIDPTNNHPITEKYTPMAPLRKSDEALRNIKVNFEEVKPVPSDEKEESDTSDFDISKIHFLPIVTANKKETASDEGTNPENSETPAESLADIQGRQIVVANDSMDKELDVLMAEINELDFLPIVTDKVMATEIQAPDTPEEGDSESLQDIEGYSLSDFEVSFTEKMKVPASSEADNVDFNLEDESIINEPQGEDVMSWLMADNELREIECQYETVPYSSEIEIEKRLIPEPIYYDEHEAYMMALLDDLEELGDHREIPLLEEIGAEESKSFIKDRIAGMIKKFAQAKNAKKSIKSVMHNEAAELPVFSVFADLFKNIDAESKLILLDEVVAVGDEKEIEFLDGLLEDPNQKIRDRARVVLKQLIAKLSHENPSASYSKGVSAIVAKQIKDDDHLSQSIFDGLLSEMDLAPAKNAEIFDIDFELCEALDKSCDQKILNLPVDATEVSPNENGGSFFSQLRNITKLFF